MSVLTAIFQALAQALSWIFPISESGHSAIFHDFSGRFTDACSQLTGVIHIGIAIGLAVAFYKLFINLGKNFFGTVNDLIHKKFRTGSISTSRAFMLMTVLSFACYLILLIPIGKKGSLFRVLHSLSYNGTLLDEGIFFIISAALLFAAVSFADKGIKKLPRIACAVCIGVVSALMLPLSGFVYMMGIFAIAMLLGMQQKPACRYGVVMSVPTLIVLGIVELCTAVTKIDLLSALLAVLISALASFFFAKVLIKLVKDSQLTPFAVYDGVIGIICIIIGIVEILMKR